MMASGGTNPLPLEDMFQYLESPDTKQNIKQVILENLSSTKEPWLIHLLVDYYFRTQSKNVQDILGQVRDSHSKALMEKLADGVKAMDTRLPALQLLLFLVYKELPWCHQLAQSPLFSAVLKCLKSDMDVPMLMTSLMILVILLPSAPVLMGQYLPQIFDVFGRLSLFCMRKRANTPDVFFLHLQVALYSLFHRLYGMYPCKFLDFISKFFGQKENILTYEEVILPMLERVRLHPGLVMGNMDNETAMCRWKNQETQDIIVSCSKLSLDLVEGSWEDSHCPIFHSVNELSKYRESNRKEDHSEQSFESEATSKPISAPPEESNPNLLSPCVDLGAVGESPSVLIGLATPPSSHRNTPATSFLDANTSGGTPDTSSRQATPCYVDDAERGDKTPLSRSSSKSVIQQQPTKCWDSGKKPGLTTPKVMVTTTPNTTPVTPGTASIAPFVSPITPLTATVSTPIKSRSSAFGVPFNSRSPATRSLNFSASGEFDESCEHDSKKIGNISGIELRIDEQEEEEHAEENVTNQKSGPDAEVDQGEDDPDDLEVEEINEQEDKFDAGGSPTSSVSTLASQADVTAESVRQFMKKVNRIRFNSLTSNSSSDQDACPIKGSTRKRTRARSCPPFKRFGLHHHGKGQLASDLQEQSSGSDRSTRGRKSIPVSSWMEEEEDMDRKTEDISEGSSEETNSSQGNRYKPLQRDPVYEMFRRSTKNIATQVSPPFPPPVSPAFQFLFAPAKLAICNKCCEELVITTTQTSSSLIQNTGSTTTVKGTEVSLFNAWPAPELLDQYLKIGSELHAKELTHIPLTSKETVNWTHFGGVPPADEVNILRGQILLLHTQLLYERHKRFNHAKRNRRLLRKIAHVATLEEQQKTLTNQIKIQEQDIQHLTISVKLLQEDNRRLSQTQESEDYHKLVDYKTALKENKDLKASSIQLKNLLVTQREDYEKLQKKLENMQHRNQDNEKELQICKNRLSNTETLKQQVFHLEKEVLLMQELQQKCQEKLHHSLPSNQLRVELTNMITSLQASLADVLKENKTKSKLLKTFQALSADMETTVRSKDEAIAKMKVDLSQTRSSHAEQIKVLDDRRLALIHINQKLESNVMELQCQLDQQQHQKMMEKLKANKARREPGQRSSLILEQKVDEASGMKSSDSDRASKPGSEAPSVVIASGEISAEASAFDNGGTVNDEIPSSSSVRGRAETEVIDSGVGSRSSYRLDSDVSMHSVSGNSIETSDSGCWQK